jgi:DNA-binding transcriptional MerR regulator
MATTTAPEERSERLLTIGTVCRRLKDEFPDVSISKIRYLEDQGLLAPRRTQGGYRLFAESDVDRLRTILRLQRDEFLPLRVIRDELDTAASRRKDRRKDAAKQRLRGPAGRLLRLEQLCERAGVQPAFVRELEEYGLIEPTSDGDATGYTEADADVAALCMRLGRYNLAPRNLRAFRTGAEREAALLEQLVAPGLRSRNPERRQTALDDLDALGAMSLELSQLLFWRVLRAIVARS